MSKEIALTQGKVAIVDDDDFARLIQHKWTYLEHTHGGYALRNGRDTNPIRHTVLMHREIMSAGIGFMVDHINGDTLDNRKSNLRLCTNAQNMRNQKRHRDNKTSRYKGVSLKRDCNKYRAQLCTNGKVTHLGYFDSELDAARAYDQAALKYHGEFARLNFPLEHQS